MLSKPLGGSVDLITRSGAFSNGYSVPALGFGTYRIAPKDAYETVRNALRCGYRHFDCAKVYGNEAAIGRALHDGMKELRLRRKDLFITSKLWNTDHDPERVEAACRQTIDRLQVGYLDLYLMHWPVAWQALPKKKKTPDHGSNSSTGNIAADPELDESEIDLHPIDAMSGQHVVDKRLSITDTWDAMEALTKVESIVPYHGAGKTTYVAPGTMAAPVGGAGTFGEDYDDGDGDDAAVGGNNNKKGYEPLVRSLGLSNFSEREIHNLFDKCNVAPVCNQVELHPGLPQTSLKAIHAAYRLETVGYCSLGMPTRFTPEGFIGVANDPFFKYFQEHTGFSPARIVLNWSADLGHIVLVKSSSLAHMKDNAKVQQHAMKQGLRFIIDQYHTLRPVRVINPTTFRGDGQPFFKDDFSKNPKVKKEFVEAYEKAIREVVKKEEEEKGNKQQ